MASAEGTFLGIARQSAKGTPNTTDADFKYFLFRQSSVSPNNMLLPLDMEVGGGAMSRGMVKAGVTSGGGLDLIPRPSTLGSLLYGALGQVSTSMAHADAEAVLEETVLTTSTQTITTGLTSPVTPSIVVVVPGPAGLSFSGTVVVTGTDAADAPATENFIFDEDTEAIAGTQVFKTITEVGLPVRVTEDDTISLGLVDAWQHTFTIPTDPFDAPYWTIRHAPGGKWGEQYQDARVAALGLNFAGARFLEGAAAFMGGLPTPGVSMTTWGAAALVDDGPQFLAPVSSIQLPSGSSLKVLSGSVNFGLNIPLDEQWIVGSYVPDAFDINQRSVAFSLNVKVDDATLYNKMMYDGAGAVTAWAAELYEEGDILLRFDSPQEAAEGTPYRLSITANSSENNVQWAASPIGIRAGRQLVLNLTGLVKNVSAGDPLTCTLINQDESY